MKALVVVRRDRLFTQLYRSVQQRCGFKNNLLTADESFYSVSAFHCWRNQHAHTTQHQERDRLTSCTRSSLLLEPERVYSTGEANMGHFLFVNHFSIHAHLLIGPAREYERSLYIRLSIGLPPW